MKQDNLPETILVDCSEELWLFKQTLSASFDDAVPVFEAIAECAQDINNLKENTRQIINKLGDELLELGEKNLHEQLKVSYILYSLVQALVSKFIGMSLYVDGKLAYQLRNITNDKTMVFQRCTA